MHPRWLKATDSTRWKVLSVSSAASTGSKFLIGTQIPCCSILHYHIPVKITYKMNYLIQLRLTNYIRRKMMIAEYYYTCLLWHKFDWLLYISASKNMSELKHYIKYLWNSVIKWLKKVLLWYFVPFILIKNSKFDRPVI